MPLYEYQCKKCKHRFEKIQKFSDAPVKKCPQCGGPVEQLISAPAVQFKGSGWYVTDYARKGSGASEAGTSANGEAKATGDKTEKVDKVDKDKGAESKKTDEPKKAEKKTTKK